jgi:hypothetical protein
MRLRSYLTVLAATLATIAAPQAANPMPTDQTCFLGICWETPRPSKPQPQTDCWFWCPPDDTPQQAAEDASCAPQVAFLKPGRGKVVDVHTCTTSIFGVTNERTYVKIKATWPTNQTVWIVDTQGGCQPGDDWDVYEAQGPARCG